LKFETNEIKSYFEQEFIPPLPQIALYSGGLASPMMINDINMIESSYKNEFDSLALLIYKIQKLDPHQRGLIITDQLLNLHSSKDSNQYTVRDLTNIL